MKGKIYIMFEYVKLPNKLFYTSKNDVEEEISILKSVNNDKVILVMEFLYRRVDRDDTILFTLEYMINQCGYKPSTKENESNEQFREILSKLQKLKIINSSTNLKDIKPKELVVCTMIEFSTSYFELYKTEKEKIINYKKKDGTSDKNTNLKLLIYYCYLKSRMYKRSKAEGDIAAYGGKAETCNPSYKKINEDLGFTDETIKKYNDILIEINMIRIGTAGNWYYKDDPTKFLRESSNIYSLYLYDEETTKNNLKEGIKYWKSLDINSDKKFTNSKEYKNNNRKLNGELGSIVKKIKNKTATESDMERYYEIKGILTPDDDKHKLGSILDSYKGETLSQIYEDEYNKTDISEKYYELEKELGLLNEDKLTVDWDYYKWVMINYNKKEKEYYINCINKRIKENKLINKIEMKTHLGKSKPKSIQEDIWGEDDSIKNIIKEDMDFYTDYIIDTDEIKKNIT